jgi:hypothetical protein
MNEPRTQNAEPRTQNPEPKGRTQNAHVPMPAKRNPRVLIVTPEVTYLPQRMGNFSRYLTAKAGGLADVSAALVSALFDQGADVHVALPDYRAIFHDHLAPFLKREQWAIRNVMPDDRVHLAEDRAFFYLNRVYSALRWRKYQSFPWPFSGR